MTLSSRASPLSFSASATSSTANQGRSPGRRSTQFSIVGSGRTSLSAGWQGLGTIRGSRLLDPSSLKRMTSMTLAWVSARRRWARSGSTGRLSSFGKTPTVRLARHDSLSRRAPLLRPQLLLPNRHHPALNQRRPGIINPTGRRRFRIRGTHQLPSRSRQVSG